MDKLKAIVLSVRPQQWIKNLLIFAPLVFSQKITDITLISKTGIAFMSFCLLTGAVYLFNDLKDIDKDRLHPVNKNRPIAADRLKPASATFILVILAICGLVSAFVLDRRFFLIGLVYLLIQAGYSLHFKHVVILDVLVVSSGYLIRVVGGALAIHVAVSSWILICTGFLALFLTLAKRRHELVVLAEGASNHRPILAEYSVILLDQMISVVTAATLIAYCLYAISEDTTARFHTRNLIITVPFVLYGLFRYLYLIYRKEGGGTPETLLLKDKSLLLDIFLWIASIVLILRPR